MMHLVTFLILNIQRIERIKTPKMVSFRAGGQERSRTVGGMWVVWGVLPAGGKKEDSGILVPDGEAGPCLLLLRHGLISLGRQLS